MRCRSVLLMCSSVLGTEVTKDRSGCRPLQHSVSSRPTFTNSCHFPEMSAQFAHNCVTALKKSQKNRLATRHAVLGADCCYRRCSALCVCVGHDCESCKTAEPIEILFGTQPRTGPRNDVTRRDTLGGHVPDTRTRLRTRLTALFPRLPG